jgi:hypothetical protein
MAKEAAPQAVQVKVIAVPSSQPEIDQIQFWTPYFPLLLTMVGWFVVSKQNDKRERRKEFREQLGLIEQRVDDALALSTEYYALDGKDGRCPELAAKIRHKLASLGPLQKRLQVAGLSVEATPEIVMLKQAIMGGQFETRARKKSQESGAIAVEAAAAGFAVVDKFEAAFVKRFS